MHWQDLFSQAILLRGKQYYRAGRVQNITKNGNKYTARVIGRRIYRVSAEVSSNGVKSLRCSCPHAVSGFYCKHMVALLEAIEDNYAIEDDAEQDSSEAAKQIFPFRTTSDEYAYFDLDRITGDFQFTQGIVRDARKMIEAGNITLGEVQCGYTSYALEGEPIGSAHGVYRRRNKEYPIAITFDKNRIRETECGCLSCMGYRSYLYISSFAQKELCVHEIALLLLLQDYLQTYHMGDATDVRGAGLLDAYLEQLGRGLAQETTGERKLLHMDARLEKNEQGLFASFRVGDEKLYVIRNLTEFVSHVEKKETMVFGTKSRINFGLCDMDTRAEEIYDFITTVVQGSKDTVERARLKTRDFGSVQDVALKSNLLLTGGTLDDFYELVRNDTLEFTDKSSDEAKKGHLVCREGKPNLDLTIQKHVDQDIFEGISVSGTLQDLTQGNKAFYYVEDGFFYRILKENMKDLIPLYEINSEGSIQFQIGRLHLSEFYYTVLPVLRQYGSVHEEDGQTIGEYLPPEAVFRFYLDAEDGNITCREEAVYGDQIVHSIDLLDEEKERQAQSFRDVFREQEVNNQVRSFFPEADLEHGLFHCDKNEDMIYRVMEEGVDRLMALGEVQSTDQFRRMGIRKIPKISMGVSLDSGILDLTVSSEGLSREELLAALNSYRKKKKYYRMRNGGFLNVESESIESLARMMEAMHISPKDFVSGKMSLPAYRALYLDKMLEETESLYSRRDSHFKKLVKDFKTVKDSDFEVPQSLADTMRYYQILGYRWLRTLMSCGFGGILADDMGLGKTLQMIAVLLARKQEGEKETSLVVCPASLVYNWQEEFRRFAPQLKVETITGTQKERAEKIAKYGEQDVIITSYDLLKRDIAEYEDCHFACQVIDEAQFIKNQGTAAAKSVKIIRSKNRFALTGTPIENRLSELWSIFDYLMPGFLYGYDTFRKEIETPIVKKQEKEASERLKRMVSPFILRRLKKDVLKDLPDKLEETRYVKLDEEQQKLYDGQITHMKLTLETQDDEEFRKNKLQILSELTRIRQICCDPSLLWEDYEGGSAKREACMELIRSAMGGEHKMLVFSQFTSMLALLEEDLRREEIAYYKITGETPKEKRVEMVNCFNADDTPVFLISLKAGGTGLNLIGADVVIHYDPWWNQAVQNQATDRAHRIGQTKIVTAYKLIVKDSIEEKILLMQERKKNLADEILSGETRGLASLTKEEVLALLGN